ncbi:protein TIC 62, chloroplastic [Neltuma alba]|uniref:protein TIC 62, chloroplastic n=1 Tax=Neltuma alba TaxID=207710 RepID=UPI0010A32EF8|nr:protein TIC 62, chloroplastic [Prosopis alba]XP_028765833.1 protein TIC 62, chloroplastic [Prosopis alba]XP_028765834.1 protein TIC 62, chloroplastic [Prosopis alba]XP_028765836.1 protein TIC 62, chloroplastic [Prosopis alba]
MESFTLQSLTLTSIPSSLSQGSVLEEPSGYVKVLKHSDTTKYLYTTKGSKLKVRSIKAQASGSATYSPNTAEAVPGKTDSKDDNVVFVAGATGKVGSRTVRELIKLGFRVRAGVRNAQRADSLVQSVKQLRLDAANASEGTQPVEMLELVECDLEKRDGITSALGNASTVICCIGASEKEVFDITGPFRIDYLATKNLIDAATVAKVNHFILVSSLGTNKIGFPAAILNLFWGVLIWKRKAEEALIASGLPYTIVRPGGMERPTDAFKETHNITLSTEDTLFGGLVSNLQIAELMAVMAKNRDVSYCKIVEAIAETTAPLTPMEELLAKIPSQRAYDYPPKTPDVAAVADPAQSASVVVEKPSITTQEETAQPKPVTKQPLSPYTVYEDLKPPSSPSPVKPDAVPKPSASDTPSSAQEKDGISQASASAGQAAESRSPYAAYEDLKPPTSPSPTPSTSNDKPLAASTMEFAPQSPAAEKTTSTRFTEPGPSQESKSYYSPYPVYPDFKPPSSPSPMAPRVSPSLVPEINSGNGPVTQLPVADKPSNDQDLDEPKTRPLSPFTMYEDLKPPASPSPSPKNHSN